MLTTKRILLLRIGRKDKLTKLKSQIRYAAIQRVSSTSFANLKLEYYSGKPLKLTVRSKEDRRFIQEEIDRAQASSVETGAGTKENLCPHCYDKVGGFPPTCPHCQRPLKIPKKATRLSLIFPGLGDWYLGHRKIAIYEAGLVLLIWVNLFVPEEGESFNLVGLLVGALFVFAIFHGIDALHTRNVARKGIYPG